MFRQKAMSMPAALLIAVMALSAGACKKKAPAPPPPPAPPAQEVPAPAKAPEIVQFTVEPNSIERGASASLRWNVDGASRTTIEPGVGQVDARGERSVSPSETTTYTLTAVSEGGTRTATAVLRVIVPTPPPPPPAARTPFADRVNQLIQDAFFDYDKSGIRDDARDTLTANANALRGLFDEYPDGSILIEGHCDERGSAEYNLGLGDRRAKSAYDFLVQLGVNAGRVRTVSYGKERQQCTEETESCYQRNRRVHFVAVP